VVDEFNKKALQTVHEIDEVDLTSPAYSLDIDTVVEEIEDGHGSEDEINNTRKSL